MHSERQERGTVKARSQLRACRMRACVTHNGSTGDERCCCTIWHTPQQRLVLCRRPPRPRCAAPTHPLLVEEHMMLFVHNVEESQNGVLLE